MARRGINRIRHAGRPADGGKNGFNNDIRSLRLTDFTVRCVFHIIRDEDGSFPGGFASRAAINNFLSAALAEMNRIWNRGFLDFDLLRSNQYDNQRVFNFRENYNWLRDDRAFSLEQAAMNIFFVNTRRRQIIGTGSKLQRFRNAGIAVVALTQGGVTFSNRDTGRIAAHETGHVLGLGHRSAGNDPNNLMFNNLGTTATSNTRLTDRQLETVHRRMSRSGEGAAFRQE